METANSGGWQVLQLLFTYGLPAFSAVAVAYLTILPQLRKNTEAIKSVRAVSNETKEEVKKTTFAITNNHPTHLRDDIDQQFTEMQRGLTDLNEGLRNLLSLHASNIHHVDSISNSLKEHIALPVDEAHELPFYLTQRIDHG